jgi:hypothetical protein
MACVQNVPDESAAPVVPRAKPKPKKAKVKITGKFYHCIGMCNADGI